MQGKEHFFERHYYLMSSEWHEKCIHEARSEAIQKHLKNNNDEKPLELSNNQEKDLQNSQRKEHLKKGQTDNRLLNSNSGNQKTVS